VSERRNAEHLPTCVPGASHRTGTERMGWERGGVGRQSNGIEVRLRRRERARAGYVTGMAHGAIPKPRGGITLWSATSEIPGGQEFETIHCTRRRSPPKSSFRSPPNTDYCLPSGGEAEAHTRLSRGGNLHLLRKNRVRVALRDMIVRNRCGFGMGSMPYGKYPTCRPAEGASMQMLRGASTGQRVPNGIDAVRCDAHGKRPDNVPAVRQFTTEVGPPNRTQESRNRLIGYC